MAAEREIKTVLTLDDASFSKGLKAATSSVSAARAEMQASVASANGLTKGLKKYSAQVTGLNKVLKAEKQQMAVLKKEYDLQKKKLKEAADALKTAKKLHAENSDELKKAANAYASASSSVDELRVKMAKLNTQTAQDKNALSALITGPLGKFGKVAAAGLAAAGAALVKYITDSTEAENTLKQNLAASETEFGVWSKFLEQEADKAWQNLGLSKSAYLAAANDIGAFLQEAGAPVQQSAEISAQVLEMAANLSKEYGVPIETVLGDIKDAANGSRTAMNRYGISVTGAAVTQTAMKYGVNKTYDAMTEEEKQLWAVKTALDQSKQAQKDYTTETNKITDASNTLTAAWENFLSGAGSAEDVGAAAYKLVSTWAEAIVTGVPKLVQSAIKMAGSFLNAFLMSFSSTWTFKIWPEIQKFFKAKLGIDLPDWSTVVANVQSWWDKNIKPALDFVANYIVAAGQTVQEAVTAVSTWWGDVKTWIDNNETLQAVFSVVGEAWRNAVATARTWWADVSQKIQEQGILKTLFHAIGDTWANVKTAVSTWWSGISKSIQENGLLQTVFHIFGDAWAGVKDTVSAWWSTISTKIENSKLIQAAVQAVGDTWNNVKTAVSSWWDNDVAPRIEKDGLFTTIFHVIGDAWGEVSKTVSSWWSTTKTKIQNNQLLQTVFQAVGDTWENVKTTVSSWWNNDVAPQIEKDGLLKTIFHIAGDAWAGVKDTVSSWWSTISKKIQNNKLIQTIFTAVGQNWENFKTVVTDWWNGVKAGVANIVATVFGVKFPSLAEIKQSIVDWWNIMSRKVAGLVTTMFGIEFPTWDEIAESWNTFWSSVHDHLPSWLQDILNFFGLGGGGSTVTAGSTALNTAANKLASTVGSVNDSISTLGTTAADAASKIVRGFESEVTGESGTSHSGSHGKFAGGMWNVPFNNYLAKLHSGEMVLTADQARRYRAAAASGGNTYNDSASIYIDKYNQYSGADADALLQQMQMMQRRQRMGYGLA